MARKQKGLILLIVGVVGIVAAIGLCVASIFPIMSQFQQVVVLESPGDTQIAIERPGTYTVWHDYRTYHEGNLIAHPETLPAGFTIQLVSSDGSDTVTMTPTAINETLSINDRQSVAVGSLEVKKKGAYTLKAFNDAEDKRVFSLTEGSFLGSMGKFGLRLALGLAAGALGVTLFIIGLVLMLTGRKTPPPSQQLPPPPPLRA